MGQLSHRVDIPFPLFDADNHLYEPPEAMTKYLPKEYKDVVQYVEVNGRTKIAIKGQISNYIPNPTFSHVAKPGAWEEYFKFGNPDGKSKRVFDDAHEHDYFREKQCSVQIVGFTPSLLELRRGDVWADVTRCRDPSGWHTAHETRLGVQGVRTGAVQ